MSTYRPPWLGQQTGNPRPRHVLVALLIAFALLAGLVGGGASYLINDHRLVAGIVAGVLWAAPYGLSAILCRAGGDSFGYALAEALGVGGALSISALWWLPRLAGAGGGPANIPTWWLLAIGALTAASIAIYFCARAEAIQRLGAEPSVLAGTISIFLIPWYLLSVVIG